MATLPRVGGPRSKGMPVVGAGDRGAQGLSWEGRCDEAFFPSLCPAVPTAPLPPPASGDSHSPRHDKGVFILPALTKGLYAPAQLRRTGMKRRAGRQRGLGGERAGDYVQ